MINPLAKRENYPKSICQCGHTGDGPRSQHEDILNGFGPHIHQGHGACSVSGCKCRGFVWKDFSPRFQQTALTARPLLVK